MKTPIVESSVLTPSMLLEHWQGHRRLTRKLIAAFPEDQLFKFSIGGMRPAGEMMIELLTMAGPGIKGIATGQWPTYQEATALFPGPCSQQQLLQWWDEGTEQINSWWPKVAASRWQETDKAFGAFEGPVYWSLLYFIDNEIHHRGQCFVYLRALGIEPPAFWDRS
ncbi:MAG: DinB family protein [Cyclobacteriaceae bacterium]